MLKTFDCPKCGAPVTYDRSADPNQPRTKVRCDYCHSQLMAPDERAGQPAQVVRIQLGLPGGGGFSKWLWVLLAIPLFGLVIGGLAVAGVLAPILYSVSNKVDKPNTPPRPNTPKKEPENSFAPVVFDRGSEGIGPGMFNDARSIAVDGEGQIYVGEYTGGRVRVFNP